MNKCYDLIILGATFTGIGAAYACEKNVLIIEQSAQVGYEFINSFNSGINWNQNTELSQISSEFKENLVKRNILAGDGCIHLPAVSPVLYSFIETNNIPILLLVNIFKITKVDNVYELEIFSASGISKIRAFNILDTTTNKLQIKAKKINAMLCNFEENAQEIMSWDSKAEFVKGKMQGEITLKYEIEQQDDWVSARYKLHEFWARRPEKMQKWTIVSVAEFFDEITIEDKVSFDTNWEAIPSCSHSNLLNAFESGVQYSEQKRWSL